MQTPGDDKRWAARYSVLGTSPVPVESNVSSEYFERERERIFKRCWLNVGWIEEIPNPRDYFVRDISILKTSVIIVRGSDGVIRGFHNVCKHRGNRIAKVCKGSVQDFTCSFHGWTYDLQGRLTYVPDASQFHQLKIAELGLTPIATEVWEGLVFINAAQRPTETLLEHLTPFPEQLKGYPFDRMVRVAAYAAEVSVNWKIFMDIFQECYHVAFVHNRSVRDAGTSEQNPLSHLVSVRLHKRHRSASVYANLEHKPAPAEALAFKYGATLTQGTMTSEELPKGVNPDRSPNWLFDINVLFPNFILDLANESYWTYSFWPIAVDRTYWEVKFYMNRARTAGQKVSQEFCKVLLRDSLREDLSILESIQAALTSGALTHIQLSDQEILLRHARQVIEKFVHLGKEDQQSRVNRV